jgi:serine/threonine-protein kinase
MESGLVPGTLVDGKYKILRLIGQGGMGSVYEGENVRIGRRVAIKVLHATMALDRRLVDRFEREAKAVARIGSHHVADVLDFGELSTGDRFMVMEYLKGQTLAEHLANEGRLAPAEVISLAAQLLDGLGMTHEAGIIHRDLKPGNIFLADSTSGHFVKILDFGICKFRAAGDAQWTTSGSTVLGTPGYLSPEQLTTDDVGSNADLYAVGVLIYRCIAGRLPYEATTKAELLIHIRDGLRIPIEQTVPDLDKDLAALVMKGIAADPKDRFPTAKDYREALLDWARKAEERERLLAEFLERPKTVSFVPTVATHPPRFRAEREEPAVVTIDAPKPGPAEDVASTVRVDRPAGVAPEDPPKAEEAAETPRADGGGQGQARKDKPPPSRAKAILVGAAVGVASVVALYEVLGK